ncbi:MAG: hypothetical protein OES33_03835 [Desulfobulbaceae bacterium]|jgi:hypothetical protein|nr:hypothetical protein [Desulfobulbaceae bacterium]HKJ13759.1 hypothetical protein [Desulfobulbales bacterium]
MKTFIVENIRLRPNVNKKKNIEIIGNSNIFAVMGMPKASTTGISTKRLRNMVTPCVSIIVRGKISRG